MSDQDAGRGREGARGKRAGGGKGGGRGKGVGRGKAAGRPGGSRGDGDGSTVDRLSGPVRKVLARLPETQREILEWRMGLKDGHPHDLADTARQMGMSLSEAREVEQRAFAHIREALPIQHLQKLLRDLG